MTDLQLYILVAIPLVGILANTGLFVHLNTTMNVRFAATDARIDRLTERMDIKFDRVDAKFEVLTGKVVDIDNRLSRLEDKSGIR